MERKRIVIALSVVISAFFLSINIQPVHAEFVPPKVEMAMIQEYSNPPKKTFTMQPIPISVTNVMNFVEKSKNRQPRQLLKYVYPTYSDSRLNSVTANLEQSNSFLLNQGYKTKIVNGVLDTDKLKEEISNNRPVIAFLTANGDYWIEQETAVIIWGYQKITLPGRPSQIVYMYNSIIHGNGAISSGVENDIPLLSNEGFIDPSADVTYSWISTLYGFSK